MKIKKLNYKINELIEKFNNYLKENRGLMQSTRNDYCKRVFLFLSYQSKNQIINLSSLTPRSIIKYILFTHQEKGTSSAQHMVYPLKSFLRFLKATHLLQVELADCILSVASHKHRNLPVTLSIQEIQRLLITCDRTTPIGLRDYAILMLLTQLGLRSCEICRLMLADINWKNAEITIHRKGMVISRFPIFQKLGEALMNYLIYGRPVCANKEFFICANLPYRGFKSTTVKSIFRYALKRASLNPKNKGPHILRHSFATELHRKGASLEQIALILGHKDILTTMNYTRVDFEKLRCIALPWPTYSHRSIKRRTL